MFVLLLALTLSSYIFAPVAGCGGILYLQSGTFSSPTEITDGETCDWRMVGRDDETIALDITEIHMEKTPDCTEGFIEVRDGYWHDSPLIGRYCGDEALTAITSTTNHLFVSFGAPNLTQATFTAQYAAICGGAVFIEDTYTLRSHQTGDYYPSNRDCLWNLIVPEGHQLLISFQSFQLEDEATCSYDYVKIEETKYCGSNSPGDIISPSNMLQVEFVSDFSVGAEGFVADVAVYSDECGTAANDCEQQCINTPDGYRCACDPGYELQPDGKTCAFVCGGTITAQSGVITSPNFPNASSSDLNCVWEIQARDDELVGLTFTYFNLESSPGCTKDKVAIADSSSLSVFCGNSLPNSILLHGTASITFTTDDSGLSNGFSLDYETFYDSCDSFEGNCLHDCIPTTEGSRTCVCDPGYTLQPNGFDCKMDPCYFEIASTSGTIQTPNYPNNYLANQNCTWSIKTTPGHRVRTNFTDMQLEQQSICAFDYVKVYDGLSTSSTLLDNLCGTQNGKVDISSLDEMLIAFKSDLTNNYRGFIAEYDTICGGTLQATNKEKYIYSHADYGLANYTNGIDCTWTIQPSEGLNTTVIIESINVEDTASCQYDYIDIWKGEIWSNRFCGNVPPVPIESSLSIRFQFVTDNSREGKGFKFIYKAKDASRT